MAENGFVNKKVPVSEAGPIFKGVKKFGKNGAHIIVPVGYVGCTVKIEYVSPEDAPKTKEQVVAEAKKAIETVAEEVKKHDDNEVRQMEASASERNQGVKADDDDLGF